MTQNMTTDAIEISGTISSIYPIESNNSQKIILDNCSGLNTIIPVEPRIVAVIKHPAEDFINFAVGDPITVKGIFTRRKSSDYLSTVHHIHKPIGFIRYNGKVYV